LNRAAQLTAAAEALGPGMPEFPAAIAADATAVETATVAAGGLVAADLPPDAPPFEQPGLLAEASEGGGVADAADSIAAAEAITARVEAPPLAPVDLDAGRPPIDVDGHRDGTEAHEPDDVETVAARRARAGRRRLQLPSLSSLQALILGLLIIDAMLIGWRKEIVRLLPQTASLYSAIGLSVNLRGLSLDDLSTATEMHEGVPILVVSGKIFNVTGATTEVPRLKLVVRDAAKREIYSWTVAPPISRLPPYQTAEFSSRLASPPAGTKDVMVRFLNRRDLMAGGG
jgi:hypothetical protein